MTGSDPITRYAGALEGRVGIVTGAGSGIGQAVAVALARSGANVALTGRRTDHLEGTAAQVRSAGQRALVVPADVADPDAVRAAFARTVETLGVPEIAVAAAGMNAWAELGDLTPEMLRGVLLTNVEGVANVARSAVPLMRELGRGKLIVIASDNGRRPEPGGSGYVASKFGVVGFALSLSQELYRSPISVHVVEPGCVDTEWYSPEEEVPRERMLRPDDVALVVLFLATLPGGIVLEELMPLPRSLLAEPWE
jgi:NAD(P)-dependent dehydrogenase (short-subunit alcohol dehydrogenase family)